MNHLAHQAMLQRPAPLTVAGVFATLQQIAHQKGQGEPGRGGCCSAAGPLAGSAESAALLNYTLHSCPALSFPSLFVCPHLCPTLLLLVQALRGGGSAPCCPCCAPAGRARPNTSPAPWCRQVGHVRVPEPSGCCVHAPPKAGIPAPALMPPAMSALCPQCRRCGWAPTGVPSSLP